MRSKYHTMKFFSGIILLTLAAVSCSTIPNPRINYHIPPPRPDSLKGKKISLILEDERRMKYVLGMGALDDFKDFSGSLSLSLTGDKGNEVPVGLFDTRSLFREAFIRRFEELGVKVATERVPGQITLVIALKEFSLDLIKRKWVCKMAYEARVEKAGLVIYKHDINGEGERLKLIGTKEADILMSEIFTDIINRLDLEEVFKKAA